MTRLASVVVNFRSAGYVERLLSSGSLDDTAVLIVDNGSEPEAVNDLSSRYGATPLLLPTNVGFARGVNAGIQALSGSGTRFDYVLIVNPDVTIPQGAIGALRHAAEMLGADAVCPLILVEGNRAVQGANGGGPLTLWSVAAYYWCIARLLPRAHGLFLNRRQVRSLEAPTQLDWLSMACILVRWDALERFGMLPEDEFMYGEDVAWGTAATKRGGRLFLVPSVTIEHVGGGSGADALDRHLGPVHRLLNRRMGRPAALAASFIVWSGLRVRELLGFRTGAGRGRP